MAQRRPHHSARSTLALILGLAALLVAIVALVIASLGDGAKGPRNVHLQRYRVGLLPTRPDEPPARDLMGASATVESESEGTAHRPERGATPAPWYGLCPYKSVASLDDFRRVVGSNQRLVAYYGSFNWDKARLVTTAVPRLVYVSYQKAGALARTKYPLLLPKGDTLLTDGVLQARTYCCNEVFEIVDAPPPPPSPQALWPPESPLSLAPPAGETPPSELVAPPGAPPFSPPSTPGDVPPSSLLPPPGGPPFSPPSPGEIPPSSLLPPPGGLVSPAPPDSAPAPVPVSPLPTPLVPPPAPIVVSEPPTVTLLSLGLAGLVWCRWRAWQRARRAALASRACAVSVMGRAAP